MIHFWRLKNLNLKMFLALVYVSCIAWEIWMMNDEDQDYLDSKLLDGGRPCELLILESKPFLALNRSLDEI